VARAYNAKPDTRLAREYDSVEARPVAGTIEGCWVELVPTAAAVVSLPPVSEAASVGA